LKPGDFWLKNYTKSLCYSVTRQSIALESCTNPQKTLEFSNEVLGFIVSGVGLGLLADVIKPSGPQPQEGSISLKFLVETRLKSEFESLIDFRAILIQNIWQKN